MRDFFIDIAINGVHPIIALGILPKNSFMVGNASSKANRSMGKLADITNDTFEMFDMADSRCPDSFASKTKWTGILVYPYGTGAQRPILL